MTDPAVTHRGNALLSALAASDLAAIQDLAMARRRAPPSRHDEVSGAIRALVEHLPEAARLEFVAFVWLGRGDVGTDWPGLLALARQQSDADTARHIACNPMLDAYIDRALLAWHAMTLS